MSDYSHLTITELRAWMRTVPRGSARWRTLELERVRRSVRWQRQYRGRWRDTL